MKKKLFRFLVSGMMIAGILFTTAKEGNAGFPLRKDAAQQQDASLEWGSGQQQDASLEQGTSQKQDASLEQGSGQQQDASLEKDTGQKQGISREQDVSREQDASQKDDIDIKNDAAAKTEDSGSSSTVDEDVKYVALTFDDGPNPEYTELLLDGLKAKGVKASFFLLGENVELYPDIVERMHEEGHLIGNHTYSHVNLCCLSEEEASEELEKTSRLIYEITGEHTEYFRPPFGNTRQKLDYELVMIEVMWDIDTLDWANQNVGNIVKKVQKVQDGDIILMHDGYAASVAGALEIIDRLTEQGYEFVTVDKLILE